LTGSDLTKKLLEKKSIANIKLAIVGAEKFQIELLQKNTKPKTLIEHYNPPHGFYHSKEEMRKTVEFVTKANADLIFLAVGSPQQEKLAHLIKPKLKKGVILCIGASIDYLTGKEKRAPLWIQKIRMEWFFRFLQAPQKRFKRYFINCPQIFYLLWKERKN
jgi:exopolysaccharide biosynthesis WecB/TagA/CpsF family protein